MHKLGYPITATYADYLASEHWQAVRRRYFASMSTAKRCACGKRGRALHHLTYVRLGSERLSDLVLICDDCHREAHGLDRQRPRKSRTGAKSMTRHVAPDPRPRGEWSYDREIRGQFVAPPSRATTR